MRTAGRISILDPMHRGITAVGVFLIFATAMATLAAVTLIHPGTPLDRAWSLNPQAYRQMSPLAPSIGIAFLLLAASLGVATVGWLHRTWWGWLMTVAILITQFLGDGFNLLHGNYLRGRIGVLLAGGLIVYVIHLRPLFRSGPSSP